MASPKKSKKSKKDWKIEENLSLVPVEPKAPDSGWWDSFFNPRFFFSLSSVAISVIRVLLFVARPRNFVRGNLPNSMVYRNVEQHTGWRGLDEGIVVWVIKRHRKATCSPSDGTKKRNTSFKKINSDAGARVSDYAVSEFVLIFQEEAWFDSVSILESDSDDDFISIHGDGFPLASNPVGNISSGQALQYERSARFVDNGCKYEEYQSYMKIDGGKSDKITGKDEGRESNRFSLINSQGYELFHLGKADEVCSKRKNILDHSYGSFKGLTEDGRDSNEKIQDNALKSGLSRLVPSVSFDDKILSAQSLVPQSQRKPSAVFRLSF
ncbi:unnamed protein product [Prunus brigantina]